MGRLCVGKLICMSGGAGSGKTTTVTLLSYWLRGLGVSVGTIQEVARSVIKDMGFDRLKEIEENKLYDKFQRLILKKQMQMESEFTDKYAITIADRATSDNLAYFLLNAECFGRDKADYINRALQNTHNYTINYYLAPHNRGVIDDGFRIIDEEYNKSEDLLIKQLVLGSKNSAEVQGDSIEERLSWLKEDLYKRNIIN